MICTVCACGCLSKSAVCQVLVVWSSSRFNCAAEAGRPISKARRARMNFKTKARIKVAIRLTIPEIGA